MSKDISTRYAKTEDGRLIIDISISKYAELFDKWDNTASYSKKDIDSELADYLYSCFKEVKSANFLVRISVPKRNSKEQEKLKHGVKRYFEYMAEKERSRLRTHIRKKLLYFFLSIIFIILSILINKNVPGESIIKEVIAEGLIIVGWVALWEVTTGLLYELGDIYSAIRIYRKIADSEVMFRVGS